MGNKKIILTWSIFLLILALSACVRQEAEIKSVPEEIIAVEEQLPSPNETSVIIETDSPEEIRNITPEASPQELIPLAEEPLTPEEKLWKERIDKAMAPTFCPPVAKPEYPARYYQGPLIDTHLHIPALDDSTPREEDQSSWPACPDAQIDNCERECGTLNVAEEDLSLSQDACIIDCIAGKKCVESKNEAPHLGIDIKMSEIACTLQHEGTNKAFAFFPVYDELSGQLLQIANETMRQYPEFFIPFIMPPGNDDDPRGSPTVDADTLQEMLAVHPGLFQGYGEIGLYEREGGAQELPPNSPRLLAIYPLIKENNLVAYFHPGEGHKDNFEKVLKQYPTINFIVHGEQIEDEISDLMDKYPNIYFTANDLYGDQYLLHPRENVESFLAATKNYEPLLQKDLRTWKMRIERHPDQFLWGTDRGGIAVWTLDQRVGQRLTDYARAFIGRLDPAVQEKFAYKNAERLLRER